MQLQVVSDPWSRLKCARFFKRFISSMNTQSYRQSDIDESWILLDAKDKTLGRLASYIATRLRGKHKPEYTPNADLGDYIVVINASKIKVTGQKLTQKEYFRHSGYPGGIKSKSLEEMLKNAPEEVLAYALELEKVHGMHLRIKDYGSRDAIINHLTKFNGYSNYLAAKLHDEMLEYFYGDRTISKNAHRYRLADLMEKGINTALVLAKDAKEVIAAIKIEPS